MNTLPNTTDDLGVVYQKTSGSYRVHIAGRAINCNLSSRFWKAEKQNQSFSRRSDTSKRNASPDLVELVAVGDLVRIHETGASGTIVEVLPRRNQFSRRSAVSMPTAHASEQVIAANVDQLIAVFSSAQPAPSWNLLDRYLVTAEAADLPALVCITKLDLAKTVSGALDDDIAAVAGEYRQIGYPVTFVSAVSGEGVDEFRALLAGRVSVLVGKSGVGKTSLLNAIEPGLGLRVGAVSHVAGKGRHTTTHQEMFPLQGGGAIIDTPGMREFGLWGVDQETLAWSFPEMRPHLGQCRFGLGCTHNVEPDCAVRQAVIQGQISPRRYHSYLRLTEG